jgi:hypothetical protein
MAALFEKIIVFRPPLPSVHDIPPLLKKRLASAFGSHPFMPNLSQESLRMNCSFMKSSR